VIRHLTDAEVPQLAGDVWRHSDSVYERIAAQAVAKGFYRCIHGRADRDVYLVRCWLFTPVRGEDGHWDSTLSLMLHYFPRPDDDACLHDHPWNFDTTILSGGYTECLPPATWEYGDEQGPAWNENMVERPVGKLIEHAAVDLHCVSEVQANTWTMVRTGPKIRSRGFHPPGKLWIPWREYINQKQAMA
jgi:hypothetical protein